MRNLLSRLLKKNPDENRKSWPEREERIRSLSDEGPTHEVPQKQTEPENDRQSERPVSEDDSPQDHNDEQVIVLDDPKLGRRVIRMRTLAYLRRPKKSD